jgi:hypothetical protein
MPKDLSALVDAQYDLDLASKAALQAFTLSFVKHPNEVFVEQMLKRLTAAAGALGYKLVKEAE